MTSDIELAIGFVKHIVSSIEKDDKAALEGIRKQLIHRIFNKEQEVRIAHSSLIPMINYDTKKKKKVLI